MNIGLFGGTFDPLHYGHIAMARASLDRYQLKRIYFVPANIPPHKRQPFASYFHRYAMVALATAAVKPFLPSLLDAPGTVVTSPLGKTAWQKEHESPAGANYSIDTVRRLKQRLRKSDRVFFLIGIDAFREIATWHQAEALFQECAGILDQGLLE